MRARRLTVTMVALFGFGIPAGNAVAHPGGLNKEGCHAGSQPYHCHNRKSTNAPAPAASGATQGLISDELDEGPCHPSYRGKCVPDRGVDVDCWPGRGNGPLYIVGPIEVVGPDVFELDRDGNGLACEPR